MVSRHTVNMNKRGWPAPGRSEGRGRRGLPAAVAIGLAVGLAAGLSGWAAPGKEAPRTVAAQDTENGAVGSQYPLVDLRVAPRSVTNGPAGTYDLLFDVSVAGRFEQDAAFQFVYTFVDDHGQLVGQPTKSAVAELRGTGESVGAAVRVPARLKDGYYMLRVTAAGSDGEAGAVVESENYLKVRRGQVIPVGDEEWFSKSAAMQAIDQ